tara:strand:- start:7 stop:1059 length:1053 start_codon:yes stop_codon:yes gene_type:complete
MCLDKTLDTTQHMLILTTQQYKIGKLMSFIKWPSIGKFSDVYHHAHRNQVNKVMVRGKIKLHGTNAAIRFEGDELVGQKRSSDVRIGDDNAGFAAWLNTVVINGPPIEGALDGTIIYGEWAGPGTQDGNAVASIPSKKFFVFAAYDDNDETFTVDPEQLKSLIVGAGLHLNEDIIVLPWYTKRQVVPMLEQEKAQEFIDGAMKIVDEIIAVQDPYIKEMFDVEGVGEGIVYYALDQGDDFRSWMFKVKTDAHTTNKSKVRNHVAPEKPEGMDEFVDMFFTDNRFKQMLDEQLGGVADRKQTGDFIRAVMVDVHKESVNEIELAEFEWGTVAKYAVTKTRVWFFDQADSLA